MIPHSQISPKIAVFLGPSLPRKQANTLLKADFYPPAQKGDIYRIVPSGVQIIIIIDGVFHSTPSVWHREILSAIEEGIQVMGSSSMGALRAAELQTFGMVGCGTIFEWYRDGVIDGDDEVALLHGNEDVDFRPMSEPLVNIRYTLLQAVKEQCITAEQAKALISYAKELYYPERSYWQLLRSPVVKDWSQEEALRLEHYFRTRSINLKMNDAIALLGSCTNNIHVPQSSVNPDLLYQDCKLWRSARFFLGGFYCSWGVVRGEEVLHKAKQNTQLLAAMRTKLSTRCFLINWARQNNIHCPDGYIKTYIEKHKKTYGVNAEDDWLRANGLTTVMYKELLSEHALVDWIVHQKPHFFGINCNIQAEAQNERLLAVHDEQVSYQEIGYSENYLEELSERYFLLEWAVQNGVSCPPDFVKKYTTQWETEHVIYNFVDWLNARGLTFLEYWNLMSKRALVEWIIQQGPTYFGMLWNFDLAMLNELQITGHAMQLMQEMEVLC